MKVLVLTDDRVGPVMAGSALRSWELSRVLLAAGHEVVLGAAAGSSHPEGHGPPVVVRPPWRWAQVVVSPPWCLPPRSFLGGRTLVVDGATPLLAELAASSSSRAILRRRKTAAARLPLVEARADAVLVAGDLQARWWSGRFLRRPEVPMIHVPFGIPEADPPPETGKIEGVPEDWAVVLWWGGVWPWLDLDTLLAARARMGRVRASIVVPTAARPGEASAPLSTPDLLDAAHRHGLSPPAVVPLESWIPYAERHRILNRSAVIGVLHHPGPEAELSFRTRALDGVWAGVPVLLTEGGTVAQVAQAEGWGAVVPPGHVEATAAAIELLLGKRTQSRCRSTLESQRDGWRWSVVARPLVEALPHLPLAPRRSLAPAALKAASVLAGAASEERR